MLCYKAETHVLVGVLRWDCSGVVMHLALTSHRCLMQVPQCNLKPFLVGYREG